MSPIYKSIFLKLCVFTLGLVSYNLSYAQCSTSGDPVSITGTNCPNVVIASSKADVNVQSGAYVGTTFGQTTPALSIQNSNVINLNNYGVIQGQSQNTSGIEVSGSSVVNNINNTNQINGALYAIQLTGSGRIGTINNSGSIINNGNTAPAQGIFLSTAGGSTSIATINNLGAINGSNGAIYLDTASSAGAASIGAINNSGSINGGQDAGILVGTGNNVGVINNNAGGDIRTSACNGLTCYNSIRNWGTIAEINNSGIIAASSGFGHIGYGIENNGLIKTLNNAQPSLTYTGALPNTYNIIINSSSQYGSLVATSPTGLMNFGIHSSSAVPSASSTYTNVLSGITAANLSATSGMFAGGFVVTRWLLSNTSGSSWDLNTSQLAAPAPVNGSASANIVTGGIATAYNAVAANPAAANPILANGQTFTTNVNSVATAAQAAQIGLQANAEGYSSNRTIRLEQMNNVSNTVLDRIDSPAGKGTNATNRVQLDDGRYIWGDIGGSRGNVNSYNNLASFGYDLVDMIVGGDLYRDNQKSYGVFGGLGYSNMTNSQTVVQSFNSTSYYLGGYGSYYFADKLKLSGVGGYVYSANNSSRSLPSVAGFTGGNGSDSYGSNGLYAAAKVSKDYVINDSFTLVPFAGQSYAQFWTKGVTETGGGDFNVSIASATSYSTVSFAGLDLVVPLVKGVKDPLSLVTFYKFGYDWFANTNAAHSVTATYTNLPLAPQTYVGANMGPVSQQVGLGLQGALSKDVTARIGAVASFNTNGQEYGGGAEVRFKF